MPGYQTTLSVGHLVIEVVVVLHPRAEVHIQPDDRFVDVWPIRRETVEWPPRRKFKGVSGTELL
jgi:hypothetical protein